MSRTIAYVRVSTNHQDTKSQKYEIMEYAQKQGVRINKFFDVQVSGTKGTDQRRIDELLETLDSGDCLIISELSRLGRSTVEVISIVNRLVAQNVRLIAIKQGLVVDRAQNMQTKIVITMFSLFAELERDLISERTRLALEARKVSGLPIGRPKGAVGKSKLDGKEKHISELICKKVSIASIAKICGVSRGTLYNFITSRKL